MSGDAGGEEMRVAGLSRRGVKGIWQHARRVPKRYEHLERRQLIRTSLHTQEYGLALAKAAQIELLQNQEWELALQNPTTASTTREKFDRLKQIAELRGFTYLAADQVAQLPLNQVCERIEQAAVQPLAAPAVLGEEKAPKLTTKNWLE